MHFKFHLYRLNLLKWPNFDYIQTNSLPLSAGLQSSQQICFRHPHSSAKQSSTLVGRKWTPISINVEHAQTRTIAAWLTHLSVKRSHSVNPAKNCPRNFFPRQSNQRRNRYFAQKLKKDHFRRSLWAKLHREKSPWRPISFLTLTKEIRSVRISYALSLCPNMNRLHLLCIT